MKTQNVRFTRPGLVVLLSLLFQLSGWAVEPQILVSLALPNGVQPQGGLILGPDGNFYGTTRNGGSSNDGTIFRMTPDGVLTSLFAFNGTNGSAPRAGLALGKDGDFYGTTTFGGSSFFGTIFRFSTNGTLTTLASFDGTNGGNPQCQLVMDSSGNFYGTVPEQGPDGFGTVFRLATNDVLTTLVSFNADNGANPEDGLTLANDGNLYGTTVAGGSTGAGTVFRVTPEGVLTTLFTFNDTNGPNPNGLLLANDGTFYGTTAFGGTNSFGTIFNVTTNGVFTTLFNFHFTDGQAPSTKMVFANDGNLYGTTFFGGFTDNHPGTLGLGTVFRVTPNGLFTSLVQFQGTNGSNPAGPLALGNDGNLYGTTANGGPGGGGTIFRISPSIAVEVSIPDPGLNAAIRQALQKPAGTLTDQDLLSLTDLDARGRNIRSLQGLEAARNLVSLNLQSNQLSNFSLPSEFTNLTFLDLSDNQLSSLELPSGLTALVSLNLRDNQLTELTLPLDMTNLTTLLLDGNPLRSLTLSQQLATTNLAELVASLRNQGISLIILQPTTNPPPTVAISSPTNGASFTAPATITIQATARDSDGSVTNIQFFDGTNSLGNVSSSPYNLSVSLAVGSHALTAVASDNLGNTTTSLAVTVTVTTNTPPTVTAIVISGTTRLPDGTFQFAFTNTPGASFTVLTATNSAVPVDEWTSAGAAVETSPGSFQFTDATTDSLLRFYRVRSP